MLARLKAEVHNMVPHVSIWATEALPAVSRPDAVSEATEFSSTLICHFTNDVLHLWVGCVVVFLRPTGFDSVALGAGLNLEIHALKQGVLCCNALCSKPSVVCANQLCFQL